jgi:hypothetical protein
VIHDGLSNHQGVTTPKSKAVELTDEQMRVRCAEALGWKHLGPVGVELTVEELKALGPSAVDAKYPGKLWCLSGGNDWWLHSNGRDHVCGRCESIPDPLNSPEDAWRLADRFPLIASSVFSAVAIARHDGETDPRMVDAARLLVECVAKGRCES